MDDNICIFTLKWWLTDKKKTLKAQNEPPKKTQERVKTKSNHIKSPYSLFIPSLFDLLLCSDKKMSSELGAGGGWGLQRQREGLIMTVMLKSDEQCECWEGM